jgi:hypothetical protein
MIHENTVDKERMEKRAMVSLSKLTEAESQKVSPSKNCCVCPWLESDQPLNRVYAKLVISPTIINRMKRRPQTVHGERRSNSIKPVSTRLYKQWKLSNCVIEGNMKSKRRHIKRCEVAKKVIPFQILSESFDAHNERVNAGENRLHSKSSHPKYIFTKQNQSVLYEGKRKLSCVGHKVREFRDIVNIDSRAAMHNNPCIIVRDEKQKQKQPLRFSEYYTKLMKENVHCPKVKI